MNTDYKYRKIVHLLLTHSLLLMTWLWSQLILIRQWWDLALKTSTWWKVCEKMRNMEQSNCWKQHRYCCSTYWAVVDIALSS